MKILKNILLIFILVLLLVPLAQSLTHLIKEKRLEGFFRLKDKPTLKDLSAKSWFNGSYQEETTRRIEDHAPFRNTLFRIHNQYDYSIFGITHALGFIRGKKGNLIEEDYINEYTGRFFIGKNTINKKLDRMKEVYQDLKKKNVNMILVIEPGKASFYPEYIPDHYRPRNRTITNYEYMVSGLRERNIPFLDLNRYFLQMKDTSRYPLFPKYGMHWSIYGMWHALDTLTGYIKYATGMQLPVIRYHGLIVSDSLRESDDDIGVLLNLIFPLPRTTAAYPIADIEDNPEKRNLSVLVIADSYYVNIEKLASKKLFARQEFWYYNSKVYPHVIDTDNPVYVDKSSLEPKLQEFNIVLLMVSEINLHCMLWNFFDEAWLAFHSGYQEDPVYKIENSIRNDREWFRFLVAKAHAQGHPLEEMIRMDAEYMYNTQDKK